jgi:hypothetical protein
MSLLLEPVIQAAILFSLVFALNLLPAFTPPTWVALAFIGLTIDGINPIWLALLGAGAAASGRMSLAKLARVVIRGRLLSDAARENIDTIKDELQGRRKLTFAVFLMYAFSPLPSNYLFIAYGLTALPLRLVVVPFFVGRLISYTFWIRTASWAAERLNLESLESASYIGLYFLLSQILLIPVIYGFIKIDWHTIFRRSSAPTGIEGNKDASDRDS